MTTPDSEGTTPDSEGTTPDSEGTEETDLTRHRSLHRPDSEDLDARSLIWLTLIAAAAGAVAGFVGGAFRWMLMRADEWRGDIVDWSVHHQPWGLAVPVLISAAAAAAATQIVVWVPRAGGSGIQHVEAVERGEAEPPDLWVIPARFVGGLLSVGVAGMVLGREGPTVHMAAAIGTAAGRLARAGNTEIRHLQTVLAGTGLGVAFNAPIGAAFFVFEEIAKEVRVRTIVWTLAAVAIGVGCSRLILGDHPDFGVQSVTTPSLWLVPLFVVFGAILGLMGVAYNWLVMKSLALFDAVTRVSAPVKSACIGALIGAVLLFAPEMTGGGDSVSQRALDGYHYAFFAIVVLLAVRFIAGPLSYSAGTPGGLFAPLLALGALTGLLAGRIMEFASPGFGRELMIPLVLVGMSSLFAAAVRAPFTGVVLVIEMTTVTEVTIPMLVAGAAAVIVATLMRSAPIYDSLRERMLRSDQLA
ncbi:chloride channel protein [Gordonia sp. NPDC003425]